MACPLFFDLPGGVKMPAVGLGTRQEQGPDDKEMSGAIDTALELGYRHFDCAFLYDNEEVVGRVLNNWIESGRVKREDLFITTKLPLVGIHPDRVELFMKKSLANLQLDYVDLYLVHFPIGFTYAGGQDQLLADVLKSSVPQPITDHIGVWKKMEEQVQAGRTRTIGLSNFNVTQIDKILRSATIKPANLQVELHVYLQQTSLVDFCHSNGISVVAYAPLCTPAYNLVMRRLLKTEVELPKLLQDPVLQGIAQKHRKTVAQVALKFLLQKGIAVVPKSVTPSRIKENIDLFDFTLDGDDLKAIEGLDRGENGRICKLVLFPGFDDHPDFPYKSE